VRLAVFTRRTFSWVAAATVVAVASGIGVLLRESGRHNESGAPRGAPPEPNERVPSVIPVPPAAEEAPVALGVMLFKSLGGSPENDWMREALRDALNTELSQLSHVKVYSKEFLDFLITRKNLTEIEAATQLGIKKMLSGSFTVSGNTLLIETHVVDVESGVLELSYRTVGRVDEFAKLRSEVVLDTIGRLNLPVTTEERRALVAERENDVDPVKRLLEVEGATGKPAQEAPAGPAQPPRSSLPCWIARLDLEVESAASAEEMAHAADSNSAEQGIRDLLEKYRKAMESGQLDTLALMYDSFPPEQRVKQQHYFEGVRDLRVTIANIDIAVVGTEAVVSYTRTDDFVDVKSGRPVHVSVRLTKTVRQEGGAWRLVVGS
jgi:TolB-like protein